MTSLEQRVRLARAIIAHRLPPADRTTRELLAVLDGQTLDQIVQERICPTRG